MSSANPPMPPSSPPPPPPPGGYGMPVSAPQNGMGTASLVLGIIGLLCCPSFLLALLALIFGAIGRKKASQGLATNGGAATAGFILGLIGVIVGVVFWIINAVNGFEGWEVNWNA